MFLYTGTITALQSILITTSENSTMLQSVTSKTISTPGNTDSNFNLQQRGGQIKFEKFSSNYSEDSQMFWFDQEKNSCESQERYKVQLSPQPVF